MIDNGFRVAQPVVLSSPAAIIAAGFGAGAAGVGLAGIGAVARDMRFPPWISLVEREEVPLARSFISARRVL